MQRNYYIIYFLICLYVLWLEKKGPLWGRSAARVQRVQKVHRVQRGWWRLTPQILKKRGRGWRRGLCRRVASLRSGGDSACSAEGGGIALSGDEYKVSVTGFTFCVI